jgi:formylglycine-generating enzyme required for sulfatase activity
MPEPRKLKVFLCHSSNDKPAVRELYQKLCAEAWVDPWLDEEKLFPGQDWNLEIEKAVEAADAILVCLSNNSITKEGYVQRELRIVLDYADYKPEGTLYLIPVRLEDCEPPRRLRPWQYADYFPPERRERAFGRLIASLQMRAEALGIPVDRTSSPTPVSPIVSTVERSAASVLPERLTLNGMEFCRIPAGSFLIGSKNDDKDADDNEKPQHMVKIPYDYWLARFTVTNEQYGAFVRAKGGQHPVSYWRQKKDHPVVNVSWQNAVEYCRWFNSFWQAMPVQPILSFGIRLSSLVLRLPTEAEWEKAACATDGRLYPWGSQFDRNKCNTIESGKGYTTPVGAYSPAGDSPYGCADLGGNVWEWTHSLFKKYPYKVNDGRETEHKAGNRVLRGGAFSDFSRFARCVYRYGNYVDDRFNDGGFRVCIAPSLKG